MTDANPAPRPASLAGIIAILASLILFLLLTLWAFDGSRTLPPYGSLENAPKDVVWQTTAQGRRDYMLGLRAKQEKQAASYGWVDQKAGIVQIPVERAMELIAQENSGRK